MFEWLIVHTVVTSPRWRASWTASDCFASARPRAICSGWLCWSTLTLPVVYWPWVLPMYCPALRRGVADDPFGCRLRWAMFARSSLICCRIST